MPTLLMASLLILPAIALAVWTWLVMEQVEAQLRACAESIDSIGYFGTAIPA